MENNEGKRYRLISDEEIEVARKISILSRLQPNRIEVFDVMCWPTCSCNWCQSKQPLCHINSWDYKIYDTGEYTLLRKIIIHLSSPIHQKRFCAFDRYFSMIKWEAMKNCLQFFQNLLLIFWICHIYGAFLLGESWKCELEMMILTICRSEYEESKDENSSVESGSLLDEERTGGTKFCSRCTN